ncbi:hypothetical protein B0H10DRAFT_2194181 [Mycena sp. CBHHK59/15]|nr:hypothetical protein B0H10DRAFT_2194181 [Mycena sp. CBHHK59/15]
MPDYETPSGPQEPYISNEDLLEREIELIHQMALEPELGPAEEDDTVPRFLDELNDIDGIQSHSSPTNLDGPEDDEEIARLFGAVSPEHEYAPLSIVNMRVLNQHPEMCFMDILDNLPRLRLSSSQIKMVLWILRECGARDVPSFKALRATQSASVKHAESRRVYTKPDTATRAFLHNFATTFKRPPKF